MDLFLYALFFIFIFASIAPLLRNDPSLLKLHVIQRDGVLQCDARLVSEEWSKVSEEIHDTMLTTT